jgi:hypothetical protein
MNESLTVVRPNGSEFSVDMTELRRLEARQAEASGVGRLEALGLMDDMKCGYQAAGEIRANIGLELDRSKAAMAVRKAVVYLDLVPDILKAKGLSTTRTPGGSEEQREAVLALDAEHGKLQDYTAQLKAAYALMQIKMDAFQMTYSSLKRQFDDMLPGMLHRNYNGGAQQETRAVHDFVAKPEPIWQQKQTHAEEIDENYGIAIGKARY